MFSILLDDAEPLIWRFDDPDGVESRQAVALLERVKREGHLLFAHHAAFELAIATYRLLADVGVTPPAIDQIRCTQAMCRRAAIPPSLAKAAEFLKLGEDKDKRGKSLIHIFSDQNRMVTLTNGKEKLKVESPLLESVVPWDWTLTAGGETMTVRAAWEAFIAYCKQDTRVERRIHLAIPKFEMEGAELDGFLFDLRMNLLGIPVNVAALGKAQEILDAEATLLGQEFNDMTGLTPTQTAKVLKWLQERGYNADNLQAETMEGQLGSPSMTPEGQRALEIRAALSFAAVKKVKAMLNTACPDDTMRGLFTWYGAMRTGRWTSQGPQPQNAKKPTIKNPDEVYRDVCDGIDVEAFNAFYENPFECIASIVRNFIRPHTGMMLDADYSNIESRVAALIAGQDSMLQAYRDGRDLYKELAVSIFKVPIDDVTKDQRFVAKTASLACVYQTGAKTFHETCAMWGMPIEKKLACHTVRTFRETNDQFPVTWRRFEAAATKAIKNPGEWFPANDFVSFGYSRSKPFARLLMKLPSGRHLVYPLPEVKRAVKRHRDYETGETREWETDEISFYGTIRGTANWGRVSTYAGDLFQSSVQGTARDIMQHGCVQAEKLGYKIFSIIHDQALALDGDLDGFVGALCSYPDWLPKDFPLVAEANRCAYYSK